MNDKQSTPKQPTAPKQAATATAKKASPIAESTPAETKSSAAKKATANNEKTPSAKKAETSGEKISPAKKAETSGEKISPAKKASPLAKIRASAKKAARTEEVDPAEAIRRQYGLSEDDTDIIFELGYDAELRQTVGQENLQRLKLSYERKLRATDRRQYYAAFGYRGEAYDGKNRRESILAAYVHDRKLLIARVVLTALATLILLFLDRAIALERSLSGFAPERLWLLPLLSLVILIVTALLSGKQLLGGARSLIRFSPTPYATNAILVTIAALYDLCLIFSRVPLLPASFLVSLALLVSAVGDVFRLACELRVFRLLSSDEPKQVLIPAEHRRKKLRRGDKIVKVVHEDSGKNLYRIRTAEQVTGFFRRFNGMEAAGAPFMTAIIIMLALSVLCAFAAAVYAPGLANVLSSFMTVLLLCAPISSGFGYFYSLFLANRYLARYRCALVGNETVEEYDVEKTVIFADSDLLTARKQTEIATGSEVDLKRDLLLSGLLFSKLGGPLGDLIKVTKRAQGDTAVHILRLSDSGAEARIDDRYTVLAGDAEFLRKSGVSVPAESSDKALRRTPNVALLHVAVDGVLRLSFEIEYECKQEFECLVADLAYSGSAVGIYTHDPSLNDEFIPLCRPRRPDPVSVFKPTRFEEDTPLESVDAGAVSLGERLDLVYPLHASSGVASARRSVFRMQVISALIGTAAAVLLTLGGLAEWLGPLSIAAYQLFWTLLSLLASHAELNGETLRFRK
ncbi:MAG: hypothetical protein IIU88_00875 [Clostridia bacterium]|nr:hypothetical protein [Clostridia bacterium]